MPQSTQGSGEVTRLPLSLLSPEHQRKYIALPHKPALPRADFHFKGTDSEARQHMLP